MNRARQLFGDGFERAVAHVRAVIDGAGLDARAHLRAVGRVVGGLVLATLLWRCAASAGTGVGHHDEDGSWVDNVGAMLERTYGLELDHDSATLLTPLPTGAREALRGTSIVFLARRPGEPRDVYLLEAELSPGGIPLDTGKLVDLSSTADADESELAVAPPRVAFAARSGERFHLVQVIDLRGEDPALLAGFTREERLMAGVTNVQETGRWLGFDRRLVDLDEPATAVGLSWDWAGGTLTIRTGRDGKGTILYDAERRALVSGKARVVVAEKGKSSLLGWAVDTVRALPFVGPGRIGWLEDQYYTLLDEIDRTRRSRLFVALHLQPKEPDVAADIGDTIVVDKAPPVPGWPPRRIKPMTDDPKQGEGEWQPQTADINPYYRQNPNAPVPLYETFLRPDVEKKPGAIVYAIAFDPRQVSMDMIAGTKEPKPSTGAVGTGEIPRDDRTLLHLIAAFEGGWQTIHADFGERTDGVDITAPQPYGATLARMDDETIGIGTWGAKGGVDSIPPAMVSFRQNLTPLTSGDKFNPYEREWWGSAPNKSAPPGVAPTQFINRSALCVHRDGYLVYFFGKQLNADLLAKTVIHTGCTYTIMLDVNFGMAGFEYYRVHRKGDEARGAQSETDYSVVDKPVPERPDLLFDARELVHQMAWPRFPRYIGRDARDFIILKLRDILPGADLAPPLAPPESDPFPEGRWQIGGIYQGRPQDVFPPTVAWTYVRPDAQAPDVKVDVVKIDPRKVDFALSLGVHEPEAPAGLADLAEGATDLVAYIGLGVTDPASPPGLATEGHVHFAPQPGWPTLAVYRTNLYGREPRVAIGRWGQDLPATTDGLLALVQSRPDGRRYQSPLAHVGGDTGLPATAAATAVPDAAGAVETMAAALDPAGFLVVASAAGDQPRAVEAALRLAGCAGTIVRLDAGRSPGTIALTKDGQKHLLLPHERGIVTPGESELLVFSHPRPYAERIFTDTPQSLDRDVVDRAQKFRHIKPASQPTTTPETGAASQPGEESQDQPGGEQPHKHRRRHHAAAADATQ